MSQPYNVRMINFVYLLTPLGDMKIIIHNSSWKAFNSDCKSVIDYWAHVYLGIVFMTVSKLQG